MSSLHPQASHKVAGARCLAHGRKSLPCTFLACPKMFYTQSGLTQHILQTHQAFREPTSPPLSPGHLATPENHNDFDFLQSDDWPWDNTLPSDNPELVEASVPSIDEESEDPGSGGQFLSIILRSVLLNIILHRL